MMKDKFYIKLANLNVEMNSFYDYSRTFCSEYLCDCRSEDVQIVADATLDELKLEMQSADEGATEEYAESLCLYRHIAEQLPNYNCFVFHGAAISYGGKGYLFTAPSGTGKSTHIKLWRNFIGTDVDIINGDKPILRINPDGTDVCSTPWAGKERWQKNITLPLGAICILARGKENKIRRITPNESVMKLMHQIYLPKNNSALGKTLELLDDMLKHTPIYVFECDISEDAVKTSFTALTGEEYPSAQ